MTTSGEVRDLEALENKIDNEIMREEEELPIGIHNDAPPPVEEGEVLNRLEEEEPLPSHPLMQFAGLPEVVSFIKGFLAISIVGYTIAALIIDADNALPIVFIEIFVFSCWLLGYIVSREAVQAKLESIKTSAESMSQQDIRGLYLSVMLIAIFAGLIISRDDFTKVFGFVGVIVIIVISYVFSWKRRDIKWRPVVWGFSLQFIFGLFILRTDAGQNVFEFFGEQITVLQEYTNVGTAFVFGGLLDVQPFALTVLPVIILYAGLASVLFHFGILQKVTQAIGSVMMYTMGTSAPESLSAAGNIFLGQTESPLLIKPYLPVMTNSEIHAVMTGGFATVAGGVLVIFIQSGIPAEHLLSASVMSAPAALAISKIVYPETMKVNDAAIKNIQFGEKSTNALEAFSRGASLSISLIANIIANLIAFLALIALLNEVVRYTFDKLDVDTTFEQIVGYIFAPFAFVMGIPFDDCGFAGELLGIKTVANEFVAYFALLAEELPEDNKTFIILTYALCGFANFSSIGIQIGALGAMAPSKLPVLSQLAFSAMLCGNLACFMTASIASILL